MGEVERMGGVDRDGLRVSVGGLDHLKPTKHERVAWMFKWRKKRVLIPPVEFVGMTNDKNLKKKVDKSHRRLMQKGF